MSNPALAKRLWEARRFGHVIDIVDADTPEDQAASYAVQAQAVAESGLERAGWKVGSTSLEAQKLLGTSGPGASPVLAPFSYGNHAVIPISAAHQPGLEGEFALHFGKALPARTEPYGEAEVLDAINGVAPGLEIVGSRRVGGLFGQGRMLVNADFGANIAFAGGAWLSDWRSFDLAANPVTLYVNDALIAEGAGALALGSPLNVAVWLANNLSERGIGIHAGEYVTTGTCTGVKPVKAGDRVRVDFGPLGTLDVSFIAL
ncbi:MAG: 2-keto-4-pentenoate hydratase [Alphaproteobacteria bacterium]